MVVVVVSMLMIVSMLVSIVSILVAAVPIVPSVHMARLDIPYTTVAMVVVRSIPNRYMMVAMASYYRQVRSPLGGGNKDGEEQSNLHDDQEDWMSSAGKAALLFQISGQVSEIPAN